MLARAAAKFPTVLIEKVGLQEMEYQDAFEGAVCVDAMEMVSPEDWPVVLQNLCRALKPDGYLYLTVELAAENEVQDAFTFPRLDTSPKGGIIIVRWCDEIPQRHAGHDQLP